MTEEKAFQEQEVEEQANVESDGGDENLSIIESLLEQEGNEPEDSETEEPPASDDGGETEEPDSQETQDNEPDAEPEPLITEEFAEEYTAVKPLVGKPIKELAKSYAELQRELAKTYTELQREYTKARQELSSLKEKPESKEDEPDHDDEIDIDPLEDPEGYKQRVAEIAKKQALQALEEIKREDELREQASKEQKEFLRKLEKAIPKDMDLQTVISKFSDTLKKGGEVPQSTVKFYAENPDAYIDHVKAYSLKLQEQAKMKNAKIHAKKTSEGEKPSGSPTPLNEDIASQLLNMNYNKEDWQ